MPSKPLHQLKEGFSIHIMDMHRSMNFDNVAMILFRLAQLESGECGRDHG